MEFLTDFDRNEIDEKAATVTDVQSLARAILTELKIQEKRFQVDVAEKGHVIVELLSLLKGQGLPRSSIDYIDGSNDKISTSFSTKNQVILRRSRLGKNAVSYKAGVVITDENNVLMVQEGKWRFNGKWYLPHGGVEANERFVDAARREALEESGFHFEPHTLVAVELAKQRCFRFFFSGKCTGGHLKTRNEADGESLQAAWLPMDSLLNRSDQQHRLRSSDILWLFRDIPSAFEQDVPSILPIERPRDCLYFCCVFASTQGDDSFVVGSVHLSQHLPVTLICDSDSSLSSPVERLVDDIWTKSNSQVVIEKIGLLALEHAPTGKKDTNGFLLAMLYRVVSGCDNSLPAIRNRNYAWIKIPSHSEAAKMLDTKLSKTNLTPVVVK